VRLPHTLFPKANDLRSFMGGVEAFLSIDFYPEDTFMVEFGLLYSIFLTIRTSKNRKEEEKWNMYCL
jgi:hypothetical protein